MQCITDNNDPADPNNTYWELTTDFCYVRSADFFESPEGDCEFRFQKDREEDTLIIAQIINTPHAVSSDRNDEQERSWERNRYSPSKKFRLVGIGAIKDLKFNLCLNRERIIHPP